MTFAYILFMHSFLLKQFLIFNFFKVWTFHVYSLYTYFPRVFYIFHKCVPQVKWPFYLFMYLFMYIYLFYSFFIIIIVLSSQGCLRQKYLYLLVPCLPCALTDIVTMFDIQMCQFVLYNFWTHFFFSKKRKNLVFGTSEPLGGAIRMRAASLPCAIERRWWSARADPSHRQKSDTPFIVALPARPPGPTLRL